MRHLLILATILCISPFATAATIQQMRFHCADDTTAINDLLRQGANSKLANPAELVSFYAHRLLGTPYVAHTLEGDTEKLTINIHQLDCTTFVETLYALTRATLAGRTSWRDFAHHLENLRYRAGKMTDYTSRLHYISEWIIDNSARGNLMDATPDMPGKLYLVKDIDFMTKHRQSYKSLADSATFLKIRDYEMGFRNHRFPYVKKEWLGQKKHIEALRSGDFIGLVTKVKGLDISHLGIIEKIDGKAYLLHASMTGGKVQIEPLELHEMLRRNKDNIGIRVFRIKHD